MYLVDFFKLLNKDKDAAAVERALNLNSGIKKEGKSSTYNSAGEQHHSPGTTYSNGTNSLLNSSLALQGGPQQKPFPNSQSHVQRRSPSTNLSDRSRNVNVDTATRKDNYQRSEGALGIRMPEVQVPGNTGILSIDQVKEHYRKLAKHYLATFGTGIYRQLFFDVLRRRTYSLTPPGANKGVQCILFQIIDKKVYMLDPYEVPRNSKPFYRTRINEIIWLLSRLATSGRIQNTEFLVAIHDCVQTVNKHHTYRGASFQESNPTFTIVSCNFSDNIPFPMWEGNKNRDGGLSGWDEFTKSYAEDTIPWNQKQAQAVFRGRNRPSMFFKNKSLAHKHCSDVGRTRLLHLSEQNHGFLDVSVGGTCGGESHELSRLTAREHHKFKYILYVEGNCMWADRLRNQVFGPSAILKQETPCGQFFEPLLKPMTHYIPTDFFLRTLISKIEWARSHDQEVQQIVMNSNEFAKNFLSLRGIEAYVEVLLEEYTKLLVEPDIKLENGATDVTNSKV